MKITVGQLRRLIGEACAAAEAEGESCSACSQDLPCPCEDDDHLGDFDDLDDTNITPEEAFTAGNIECEEAVTSAHEPWEFMKMAGSHVHSCHACGEAHAHEVPDMKSYAMVGDRMVIKPEEALSMIEPAMEATVASCPASAAQAIADILMVMQALQGQK